jgi:hypothetical protein
MTVTTLLRRAATLGALAAAATFGALAIHLATSPIPAQAQPGSSLLSQQAPTACVCAQPAPIFSASGPAIAHCQCGTLSCAAVNSTGGSVVLHCAR